VCGASLWGMHVTAPVLRVGGAHLHVASLQRLTERDADDIRHGKDDEGDGGADVEGDEDLDGALDAPAAQRERGVRGVRLKVGGHEDVRGVPPVPVADGADDAGGERARGVRASQTAACSPCSPAPTGTLHGRPRRAARMPAVGGWRLRGAGRSGMGAAAVHACRRWTLRSMHEAVVQACGCGVSGQDS